jgi:hypothetical protein
MRRHFGILTVVAGASLWCVGLARAGDDKAFFNGRTLEGWEGLTTFWSVKDGAIVGSTLPKGNNFNTFLCTKRTYKDFEMKFQVKLTGKGGNSGVQIRSLLKDREKFVVWGPQCDMGQQYWGSLYGEHFGGKKPGEGGMMKAADAKLIKKILKEEDFNDYYIKCIGKHVTIKLNGETTVDDDFANLPEEGIIALQLHAGGPMEVTFKNMEFREIRPRVQGKVTLDRQPLAAAVVTFADNKSNTATATTDEQGNYCVNNLAAGEYRVAISASRNPGDKVARELVPPKYNIRSTLVVNVAKEPGVFNFDLTSK